MNLQFSKGKIVDRYNFAELTEIQRNQFLIACKNAWGPRHTLYEAVEIAESEQMAWEYFEITDTKNPTLLYQAWILSDDCGTFFVVGTSQEIEIEMTQSCISPMNEDNEDLSTLSNAIEKAYEKAPQTFHDANGYSSDLFRKYWNTFYQKKDNDSLGKEYWITYFGQFNY
ncbi:MAG: hypothetical protein MUC49_05045 [Raineya sp.]|jgi:hypothetical protein|nr:hypothetical protein [Raineya sp.]